MKGIISSIQPGTLGTSAAASATTGATSLVLSDATDYSLTGGVIGLDESTSVRFSEIDEDTNIATLLDPLPFDVEVGDPLTNVTPSGHDAISFLVWADLQDGGGVHPYPADHSLVAFLTSKGDALAGSVAVIEEGLDLGPVVRSIINEDPRIDATSAAWPLFIGYLDVDQSIPGGSGYTTVTDWQTQAIRGLDYNPIFHQVEIQLAGYYSVTGSAVMWEYNTTGRRAIRPMFNSTAFGLVPGAEYVIDTSVTSRLTTPVASPLKPMGVGDAITLEVSQTSGGALDVIGDATGVKSFLCVQYCGPLY